MISDVNLEPCSILCIPADCEQFIQKASRRGADVLLLDLEDGVSPAAKARARENLDSSVRRLKAAGATVHVRVNNQPNLLIDDLDAMVAAGADGLLMPKVDSAEQVAELDKSISASEYRHGRAQGSIRVAASIESPLALCNALSIARASGRLSALLFGVEDIASALGIPPTVTSMSALAQSMVIAAAAAGLQPLGLPGSVADFADLQIFRQVVERAREIGMRGVVCIHPAQVEIINDVFGGTEQELDAARRIVMCFENSLAAGRGSSSVDGRMVDAPVAERARRLLQRHELLRSRRDAIHKGE